MCLLKNNNNNKHKKPHFKILIWILNNKMILLKVIYKKDKNKLWQWFNKIKKNILVKFNIKIFITFKFNSLVLMQLNFSKYSKVDRRSLWKINTMIVLYIILKDRSIKINKCMLIHGNLIY